MPDYSDLGFIDSAARAGKLPLEDTIKEILPYVIQEINQESITFAEFQRYFELASKSVFYGCSLENMISLIKLLYNSNVVCTTITEEQKLGQMCGALSSYITVYDATQR